MLHRGKTNKIQKITSGEALPLILPQTLFYGDEEETNLLLSFLDRFYSLFRFTKWSVLWKKKRLRRHIFV